MDHAQEKVVNLPASQITGQRRGVQNSATRTVLKPTHMVGGYAQLSYGFNDHGAVGSAAGARHGAVSPSRQADGPVGVETGAEGFIRRSYNTTDGASEAMRRENPSWGHQRVTRGATKPQDIETSYSLYTIDVLIRPYERAETARKRFLAEGRGLLQ